MSLKNGKIIAIKDQKLDVVNVIIPWTDHLTKNKIEINQLLHKIPKLFAEPNEN